VPLSAYYADEAVTLYLGDSRELAPSLYNYDHFIGDPPYDEKTHDGARSNSKGFKIGFAPIDPADVVAIVKPRRWALAFCALEMLGDYKRLTGDRWIRSGVWDRDGGTPQISGDRPAQGAEGIAIWHPDGVKRWNGNGKMGKWRAPIVKGDDRVHETQKPVSLMLQLVRDFTDVDELIADFFAGSGTTGVAAKMCGRRAVLVEIDEKKCEDAARRLQATELDERMARVPGRRGKQIAFDLGVA